jgi:outer membrane immunogenic protein
MRRYGNWTIAAGVALGLGTAGVASAADMAVKAPPMVAAVPYNWSGCFVGGNVGGGWSRVDTTRVSQDTVGSAYLDYGSENDSSFIGGGQVGCDFQTNHWVFGVQAQFDFGAVQGSHAIPTLPGFVEANDLKGIYTFTGRVGYLFTPQYLGYVRLGAAYLNNRNTVTGPGLSESASWTEPGITAGIGGEWMFAPNWSVFAEANYIWTEDDSARDLIAVPGQFPPGEVVNDRLRVITAMVGVNYKFHWDNGPVMAKY